MKLGGTPGSLARGGVRPLDSPIGAFWDSYLVLQPGFPILGVFRLKGQPKRDGRIIDRSCKVSQSPVYPIKDAFEVVEHPSCPSSSSSCPLPVG